MIVGGLFEFVLNEAWPGLILLGVLVYVLPLTLSLAGVHYWLRSLSRWASPWDSLLLFVPYFTWASLYVGGNMRNKTMANVAYEPAILTAGCIAVLLVRAFVRMADKRRVATCLCLSIMVMLATAVWAWMPRIPAD